MRIQIREVDVYVPLPCQTSDPEIWFSTKKSDVDMAKKLCHGCHEQPECLAGAIKREEPWGIWGGHLLRDGRITTRMRGRPCKNST